MPHRVRRAALVALALAAASTVHQPLRAAGPRDAMLTPVSWLAEHLHDPDLVVLQVGDPKTYPAEHIPGARNAELSAFAAPMVMNAAGEHTGLMLELPDDATLHDVLERFGISDRSRIVIAESDNWFSPSTRIYLTLVHAGLGARTSLLDGGVQAWKAAGQAVTKDTSPPTRGSLSSLRTVPVTVDAAFVQAHALASGFVLLDVRSPAAWEGVEAIGGRGGSGTKHGHIPGAKSLPLEQLWDETTSALKPAAELEKIFAAAGVKPMDTVIAYCYVGQRATATLFAAESLGHPVKLYDGSMDEWDKLNLPLEMPKKGGGW